jgi:undecaprenyl-diphosphatase
MTPVLVLTHLATKGGVWLIAMLALVAFGRGLQRRAGLALATGFVLHLALLEGALKHTVQRQRPFAALGLTLRDNLLNPESFSFPSGHSAGSFLSAWVIGAVYPRARVPLLVLAGMIAVSRIHLGAHYLTDIGVGAVCGVALAEALVRAFRLRDERPGEPAPQPPAPAPSPQES